MAALRDADAEVYRNLIMLLMKRPREIECWAAGPALIFGHADVRCSAGGGEAMAGTAHHRADADGAGRQ